MVIHALAEADRNPRLRDMLQRLFNQQRAAFEPELTERATTTLLSSNLR